MFKTMILHVFLSHFVILFFAKSVEKFAMIFAVKRRSDDNACLIGTLGRADDVMQQKDRKDSRVLAKE